MNSISENILPEGWTLKPLGDIAFLKSGSTPRRTNNSFWQQGTIPWLKSGELDDVIGIKEHSEFITEKALSDTSVKLFEKDTLLIAMYGATAGKLGILSIQAGTNQAVCSIQNIYNAFNNHYIFYFLLSSRQEIIKDSFGGAQPNISKSYLEKIAIPLPPLEEQRRIVAKIDTLFAKIDKAISLTEESLKQAKNLLPSVLKEVFENLDSPKSSLSEFCSDAKKHMVGGPFGSNLKATEYVDKGYPIIRLQNVNRFDFIEKNIKFVTQEKAEFLKSHSYVSGDIVLTKLGAPLGKCCIVKKVCGIDRGVISADIVRIRINEKENIKEFVVAGINSEVIRKQMVSKTQGTTRPRVTLKELRQMILPKPSYEEQLIIVEKIKYLKDESKQTQSKLEEQLAYLKQLKSSILSKAFRGEL